MDDLLRAALDRVLADIDATGGPVPTIESKAWQPAPNTQSLLLRAGAGHGVGVWVDTTLPEAERVAMVAEQVQEWWVEELPSLHRSTSWPPCEEHPDRHPLEPATRGEDAVWRCPVSKRAAAEIGRVSGTRKRQMSVLPVDERDGEWETYLPRFRVYLQAGTQGRTGGSTMTYDVVGADLPQVVDWAQRHTTDAGTYGVALVDDRDGRRGLVWLIGMDGNDTTEPDSPEAHAQRRMVERARQPIGIPEADRSPR